MKKRQNLTNSYKHDEKKTGGLKRQTQYRFSALSGSHYIDPTKLREQSHAKQMY